MIRMAFELNGRNIVVRTGKGNLSTLILFGGHLLKKTAVCLLLSCTQQSVDTRNRSRLTPCLIGGGTALLGFAKALWGVEGMV